MLNQVQKWPFVSQTSSAANTSTSQIGKNMMNNKIICRCRQIYRHLVQWLVFPSRFFQCCLLLKKAMWTWICLLCRNRSCRPWANLPDLSRTWLTVACWSSIWKSGTTQPGTGLGTVNALWVINHLLPSRGVSPQLLIVIINAVLFFLFTQNMIFSVDRSLWKFLSTCYIVSWRFRACMACDIRMMRIWMSLPAC